MIIISNQFIINISGFFLSYLVVVLIHFPSASYVNLLILRKWLVPKDYVNRSKNHQSIKENKLHVTIILISCPSYKTHHWCNKDPAIKVNTNLFLSEHTSFRWPTMINNQFWKHSFYLKMLRKHIVDASDNMKILHKKLT